MGKVDYFLVAHCEHMAIVKSQLESGKVREKWVREPNSWDGIELKTNVFIRDSRIETGDDGPTSGSTLKYQLKKRETATKNTARNDAFGVDSSDTMRARRGEKRKGQAVTVLMLGAQCSDTVLPTLELVVVFRNLDSGGRQRT